MPRWVAHAKALIGLRRRWSINNSVGEILTGVLPVVQVDKVYPTEDQDIFGMFCQALGDGVNLGAVLLGAQERDVLVHQVEAWVDAITTREPTFHMFTPLQTYDPFDAALQNIFFPWFQGAARAPANDPFGQATGTLGSPIGLGGLGSALMVVIVNGVPITAIGPVTPYEKWTTFVGAGGGTKRILWSFQDPPIRLRPFQRLCVQCPIGNMLGDSQPLNVNFFYTDRREQGQVS